MMASTTARASALVSRSCTKLRSIFSSCGRSLQVGQAGIARAEVVDGELHAGARQPWHGLGGGRPSSMATDSVISQVSCSADTVLAQRGLDLLDQALAHPGAPRD
jgi:hypothetical protein